jgi:ABC-type branched-subunit amino acid transport system substrate-binding protein
MDRPGIWGNREKLFTLMLAASVVITVALAGLVFTDLSRAHSPVASQNAGAGVGGAQANSSQPGTDQGSGGASGGSQPQGGGAQATPGAGNTPANHGATGAQSAGGSSGSGGGTTAPSAGNPAAACNTCGVQGNTLLVGSIITLTGPGRSKTMADAVSAWVQSVNRAGGVAGHQINFQPKDDGGNSDTGASQYREFAEGEHVFALLGECAPVTDETQVSYVNQQKLILVGECQSADAAYTSPYIWVTGPTPNQNGQMAAKMMVTQEGWKGTVAELCLNESSTLGVCDGTKSWYQSHGIRLDDGSGNNAPHLEDITGNDYQQLLQYYQSKGITQLHIVLEPGNTQRFLSVLDNMDYHPKLFMGLVIDDGIAGAQSGHTSAEGMMVDSPWTPLDQNTPGMQRLAQTLQTYYPDDKVDLYAQTGWANCLLFEHALQLMGPSNAAPPHRPDRGVAPPAQGGGHRQLAPGRHQGADHPLAMPASGQGRPQPRGAGGVDLGTARGWERRPEQALTRRWPDLHHPWAGPAVACSRIHDGPPDGAR